MLNRADLESIHRYSDHHRDLMAQSEQAGCFYCGALFAPSEVKDWIDGQQVITGETSDGVTALCPRCGIDAVLPSAAPVQLGPDLLAQMRTLFFEQ